MVTLLVIAAIACTLLLPGGALLAAIGPERLLPSRSLALPVASILSLAALSVGLVAAFVLGGSLTHVAIGLALLTILAALRGVARAREAARQRRLRRQPAPRRVPDLAGWLVLGAALAAGVSGWVLQSALYSDTLFHVAQAVKLAAFDPITWGNTAQFEHGNAHPGYVLPTFQAVIALPALAFDALNVTLLLPVVTMPLGVLASAGAAQVIAGTRRAAVVGAWAWLAISALGAAPSFRPGSLAAYGGEFALYVIAPATVGLVVAAIADPRRALLALIATATVVIGILHVSYLVHLAIPMLAIALGWLWTRPGSEDGETRRTALVLTSVLVASITITAALAPKLMELQTFIQTDGVQMPGEGPIKRVNADEVKQMLVGDDERFHLRSDLIIGSGGTQLVGLVLAILAGLAAWRRPLGWLTLGASTIVLAFLLWAPAFTHLSAAMGIDQARRLGAALPFVLGVVAAVEVVAGWLGRWPTVGARTRALAVLGCSAAAVLVGVAVHQVPRRTSRGGEAVIGEWVVNLIAIVAVLLTAVLVLRALGRIVEAIAERRRGVDPGSRAVDLAPPADASPAHPAQLLAALPVLVLCISVLITAWEPLVERREAHAAGTSRGELAWMTARDKDAIRSIPDGSVVLADIALRTSYRIMALAPVYVVGAPAGHVANTERNAILTRTQRVTRLLETRSLSDERRARLLDAWGVDVVVLRRFGRYEDDIAAMHRGLGGAWKPLAMTRNVLIWQRN